MVRQKLAFEVENKKWHESTRRASGININETTCGKIAYESNENHRKSQNPQTWAQIADCFSDFFANFLVIFLGLRKQTRNAQILARLNIFVSEFCDC